MKYLKNVYSNCPTEITQDNVNIELRVGDQTRETWSFLEEAVMHENVRLVHVLLNMGANIGYYELRSASTPIVLNTLLEAGANPNVTHPKESTCIINCTRSGLFTWFFKMLMDYGADASSLGTFHPQRHLGYLSVVSSRVASSRKALAALMILRKEATFRAVRDVFNAVAREMWGARGPSGVWTTE